MATKKNGKPRKSAKKLTRLNKEQQATREKFAMSLFVANPNLSIPKANKEIVAKHKAMMRAQDLYDLRRAAIAVLDSEGKIRWDDNAKTYIFTAGSVPTTVAQLQAAGRGEEHEILSIDEPEGVAAIRVEDPTEVAFLKKTLTKLRNRGITNLGVVAEGPTYAVVAVVG